MKHVPCRAAVFSIAGKLRRRGGAAGSLIWLLRDIIMFLAGGGGRVGMKRGGELEEEKEDVTDAGTTTATEEKSRLSNMVLLPFLPLAPLASPLLTSRKFFNRLRMTQPDQTLPVMWWKRDVRGWGIAPARVGRTTSQAPRRDATACTVDGTFSAVPS